MNSKEIIKLGKREMSFEIPFNFDWDYGVSLERLKADIEKLEELGATHVTIESNTYYDSSHISITAEEIRTETDKEFQARVDKAIKKENIEEQRERDLLKSLKEKYE